jgi:hypothetical protein
MKISIRVLCALAIIAAAVSCREQRVPEITLKGAVIRRDADPNKQTPIAGVEVAANSGTATAVTRSSVQGGFTITLPVKSIQFTPVTLHFRHAGYEPLDRLATRDDALYVIRMTPVSGLVTSASGRPAEVISNVSIRYAAKTPIAAEVGTRVKTFQVINRANVPCDKHAPCSPDGRWQAAEGTIRLDAEQGNEFRNARVSCIAGPCPFTRVMRTDFSAGARIIEATVLNWSDTTTFLAQAEVVHAMISETVRQSYPVIFDRTMNFSLPGNADGVCLEAEVNGTPIVFPLGPALALNWADCQEQTQAENVRLYRCELKPGFEFK